MKFIPSDIVDTQLIQLAKHEDERGHLVRTWDQAEFKQNGIIFNTVEGYTSFSANRGTMRGFHYRQQPYADAQLVRCLRGAIFEVVLDIRPQSKTYLKWQGFTQRAPAQRLLYVPPLVAHGFLTLEDNTEVLNLYSQPYHPEVEQGIRYNDPAFPIRWPIGIASISPKDLAWPDWSTS